MSEKKIYQIDNADTGHNNKDVRNAVIAYAIIEAVVIIFVMIYLKFR